MSASEALKRAKGLRASYASRFEKVAGIPDHLFSGQTGNRYSSYDGNRRKDGEKYRHFKDWVYTASSYIIRKVASQPVKAGEVKGATANPERRVISRLDKFGRRKNVSPIPKGIITKAKESDIQEITDHDALDAIEHPNEFQSKYEFLSVTVANLLLTGVAYWIKGAVSRDGRKTLESIAVPSWWVIPDHEDGPFTKYLLRPPGVAEGIPLTSDEVDKTYLPCPWDLTQVWSPMHAITAPASIDEHILHSQKAMFSRGIFPQIALKVGQIKDAEGNATTPRLKEQQRRQLVGAVRTVWSRTLNYGDPAILDGLIEGVEKLQFTPQEMDFIESDACNKARIFQAFGINPILVGSEQGGNRAQALEARSIAAENAVNPIIDILSCTLTDKWGPLYESPKRLLLWIEPWVPLDPAQELKEKAAESKVVTDQQKLVGDKKITPEAAAKTICHFVPEIDESDALEMVDRGKLDEEALAMAQQIGGNSEDKPPKEDKPPRNDDSDDFGDEEPKDDVRSMINSIHDAVDIAVNCKG